MTQNIYDDPDFLAGYAALPRSVDGLDGAPEWPAMRSLLPSLDGTRVVDLGCGFGWFCRWAQAQGAAVVGIDVSTKMLERAKADTPTAMRATLTYRHQDLEKLELPSAAFDLVYSSLSLHYLADLPRLLAVVAEGLTPGGRFVFSVEHPIFTAPSHPGFVTTHQGETTWPLDQYLVEGPRITTWFVDDVVKYHRTTGTYLNQLIEAGLEIRHVEEWGPSEEQISASPHWAEERHRPPFLLVAAVRP